MTVAGMHIRLAEVEEKSGFDSMTASFNILIYGRE